MSGYDLFIQQVDDALVHFPNLTREVNEGQIPILKGGIEIIDNEGKLWETYLIEVHATEDYPKRFPKVFEVGGKIERIADWHINLDGSCCIKVLPEEILRCNQPINLTNFLQSEVLPYFFNQTHRRVEGFYVNGEYSHNLKGIYEFYSNALGIKDDIRKVIQMVVFIAKGIKPGRTHGCFCGSGKKFRKCHREAFEKIVVIDSNVLKDHATQIAVAAKQLDLLTIIRPA